MRVARYLALVLVATGIAIATVHQHVERTRLGYETRSLEREIKRLKEMRQGALVEQSKAAAPEELVARAKDLKIASDSELRALLAPVAAPKGGR